MSWALLLVLDKKIASWQPENKNWFCIFTIIAHMNEKEKALFCRIFTKIHRKDGGIQKDFWYKPGNSGETVIETEKQK